MTADNLGIVFGPILLRPRVCLSHIILCFLFPFSPIRLFKNKKKIKVETVETALSFATVSKVISLCVQYFDFIEKAPETHEIEEVHIHTHTSFSPFYSPTSLLG